MGCVAYERRVEVGVMGAEVGVRVLELLRALARCVLPHGESVLHLARAVSIREGPRPAARRARSSVIGVTWQVRSHGSHGP